MTFVPHPSLLWRVRMSRPMLQYRSRSSLLMDREARKRAVRMRCFRSARKAGYLAGARSASFICLIDLRAVEGKELSAR